MNEEVLLEKIYEHINELENLAMNFINPKRDNVLELIETFRRHIELS